MHRQVQGRRPRQRASPHDSAWGLLSPPAQLMPPMNCPPAPSRQESPWEGVPCASEAGRERGTLGSRVRTPRMKWGQQSAGKGPLSCVVILGPEPRGLLLKFMGLRFHPRVSNSAGPLTSSPGTLLLLVLDCTLRTIGLLSKSLQIREVSCGRKGAGSWENICFDTLSSILPSTQSYVDFLTRE